MSAGREVPAERLAVGMWVRVGTSRWQVTCVHVTSEGVRATGFNTRGAQFALHRKAHQPVRVED